MFSDDMDEDPASQRHWISTGPPGSVSPGGSTMSSAASVVSEAHSLRGNSFDPTVRPPSGLLPPNTPPDVTSNVISGQDCSFCGVCKVSLSGVEPAKQHYAGKAHGRAVAKAEILQGVSLGREAPVSLHCIACQKDFTSEISAKQHYVSRGHQRVAEGAAKLASTSRDTGLAGGYQDFGFARNLGMNFPSSESEESSRGAQMLLETVLQQMGEFNIGDGETRVESKAPDSTSSAAEATKALPESSVLDGQQYRHHHVKTTNDAMLGSDSTVQSQLEQAGARSSHGPIRQAVVQVCSSLLEEYMKRIIPELSSQIADIVLDWISKNPNLGGDYPPSNTPSTSNPDDGEALGIIRGQRSMTSLRPGSESEGSSTYFNNKSTDACDSSMNPVHQPLMQESSLGTASMSGNDQGLGLSEIHQEQRPSMSIQEGRETSDKHGVTLDGNNLNKGSAGLSMSVGRMDLQQHSGERNAEVKSMGFTVGIGTGSAAVDLSFGLATSRMLAPPPGLTLPPWSPPGGLQGQSGLPMQGAASGSSPQHQYSKVWDSLSDIKSETSPRRDGRV